MLIVAKDVMRFSGTDREAYMTDTRTQLAVERLLEIVGEASRRVSDDFKADHPEVPWRDATDLRNVISRDYDKIDRDQVWEIVERQVPQLIAALEPLVPEEE
jgi:uncharacterized protein with HEPN domain